MTARKTRTLGRRVALLAAALAVALAGARAQKSVQPQPKNDDPHAFGYSYVKISVGDKAITNFVHDEKYLGWLTVEGVTVKLPPEMAQSATQRGFSELDESISLKAFAEGWRYLELVPHLKRMGPGRIEFGSGDDGGFGPMIEAQKRGALIPSAELVLNKMDGGRYIGRYKLAGIRVISLEDVQASACPMYDVTLSFRSMTRE